MSASAIRAGRAFVELFAEDSKLTRGLRGAEGKLKAWGAKVGSIGRLAFAGGAAALGALGAASKIFADMGSEMADLSARTGASVGALSTLKFAAEQSGATIEDLEVALKKSAKAVVDAANGSKSAEEALGHLGLSAGQLLRLAPEEQFRTIAGRLAAIENPTLRAAAALEVFGKAGTKLLPMAAELGTLEARARALGLEMTAGDVQAADALGDALSALWATVKMGVYQIGAALAPTITDLAGRAAQIVSTIANWISENRGLVTIFAAVVVAITAIGAGLIVLGGLITAAGTALGTLGTILGALFSPATLVVAAIVGIFVAIAKYTAFGGKALEWLKGRFGDLASWFGETFGAIADLIAAGELALAMEVLWSSIKVVWLTGVAALLRIWHEFGLKYANYAIDLFYGIRDAWDEVVSGLAKVFINAWAAIETGWVSSIAFLKKAWGAFTAFLVKGLEPALVHATKSVAITVAYAMGADQDELDRLGKEAEATARKTIGEWDQKQVEADRARDIERDQEKAQIEANRVESIAAAEQMRQHRQRQNAAGADATKAELEAWSQRQLVGAEAAKAAAEKARAAAREAGRKRLGELKTKAGGKPPGRPELDRIMGQMRQTVSGTFSGRAAGGLGTTGHLSRIADYTMATARNTKGLRRGVGFS